MDVRALLAQMMGRSAEPDPFWSPFRPSENVDVRAPDRYGYNPNPSYNTVTPGKTAYVPKGPGNVRPARGTGRALTTQTTDENDPTGTELPEIKRLLAEGLPEPFRMPSDVDTANLQRYMQEVEAKRKLNAEIDLLMKGTR